MSRLEQLRFKHTCSSYGPRLTPLEELELFRLEDEQLARRNGWSNDTTNAAPANVAAEARGQDDRD